MTYGYDAEGDPLSVAGSAEAVSYTYDALYRLKTLKDGNNNKTTYTYDGVGNVSSVQMPGGETISFPLYDAAGHLLRRVDGNGVTTNYVYDDPENLLTDVQYPATPALNVHFGYDSFGRRSAMTDGAGSMSYAYNDLDMPAVVTTSYAGLSPQAVSYSYSADGSRAAMATPAGTFSYSYDGAGRMASLTNPYGETTSWAYLDNGWLHTQQLQNGALATYSYNARGQLTRLLNERPSQPGDEEYNPGGGPVRLSDYSPITYDGVGNRTSFSAGVGPLWMPSLYGTGTTNYQYDQKDQLTREQSTRGGWEGYTHTFGYDSSGNPTTFKGATQTFNTNNQRTGAGFTNDSNGNPTTYNGQSLTFDPENRL